MMFHTLDTFDTEFSADSVEWCPINLFKNTFVCGTYQLVKDEGVSCNKSLSSTRLGRIYMFEVMQNEQSELLQTLDVPAVLDMKWAHVTYKHRILLGVVNSLGYLQIYELKNNQQKRLKFLMEKRVADQDETLALSLDWCTGRCTENTESRLTVVVSDSRGTISLLEFDENGLKKINSWTVHEFEAWIAAFDYWNTNIVYSGGDDCKFWRFDTRVGISSAATNSVHCAGVTSLHSNAAREFLLSSGSYDETLRLWDTRNFKRPVSEIDLGGGIWRLKWNPNGQKYLLAACMYGGFRIIDCKNTGDPSVIGEYKEHESIAYGCDWCWLNSEEISAGILKEIATDVSLIGTCSFYDHILKLTAAHLEG